MLCTVIRKLKWYRSLCFWCYEILRIRCCLLTPFAMGPEQPFTPKLYFHFSFILFILSFDSLSITSQEQNLFILILFLDPMNHAQALNKCYMKQ